MMTGAIYSSTRTKQTLTRNAGRQCMTAAMDRESEEKKN